MSAGALLAESVRTAISGLRALASALEEALHRFDQSRHDSSADVENQAGSQPSLGQGTVMAGEIHKKMMTSRAPRESPETKTAASRGRLAEQCAGQTKPSQPV